MILSPAARPFGLATAFTTCQQVLTRRHGYRIPQPKLESTKRRYNTYSDLADLVRQDPQRRIGFLPCRIPPKLIPSIYDKDAVSFSLHVIPTWTVMYQLDLDNSLRHFGAGKFILSQRRADFGFTVTAVPEGHWCHGVYLEDDFRDLIRQDPQTETQNSPDLLYGQLGETLLQNPAVPFASSFPDLNMESGQKLLDIIAVNGSHRSGGYAFDSTHTLTHFDRAYAVPLYRVAYRMQLRDGGVAYLDGFSSTLTHSFRIHNSDGRAYSDPDRWKTSRSRIYTYDREQSGLSYSSIYPPSNCESMGNLAYELSKQTEPNWNDDRIVLHHRAPEWNFFKSRPTVETVTVTSQTRIQSTVSLPYDKWRIDEIKSWTAFEEDMKRAKDTVARYASPSPAPTESAKRSSPNALRPPAPPRAPPRNIRPPPSKPRAPPVTMPRPKVLQPPPFGSRVNVTPRPAASSSTRSTKSTAPPDMDSHSTPIHLAQSISDPAKYYFVLGVDRPTRAFIERSEAVEMDRYLKNKRLDLATKHHPDRAGQSSIGMAQINAAHDALDSVEKRIHYHDHKTAMSLAMLSKMNRS